MNPFHHHITYLGQTCGRPPLKCFGIKQKDRQSHIYCIGKTGTGKSTLLANMIMQDIEAGRGCCLIDPHGDLVERIANQIPKRRRSNLIYLNAPKVHHVSEQVIGYNPLRYVRADKRSLAASGVLEVFKKMWGDSWGVRMEHILRNTILTLLEIPAGRKNLPNGHTRSGKQLSRQYKIKLGRFSQIQPSGVF